MAEKLEDLNLPIASVQKIIKEALSENISIGKDARTAFARAASVFVLYLTSHASQMAQRVNRKTLIAQDVFDALENLEFEEIVEPLTQCLEQFKASQKVKKDKSNKVKKTEENGDVVIIEDENIEDNDDDEEMEEDKEEESV